jgi:16S rRNA (guanine966-N2)-methyltransferase
VRIIAGSKKGARIFAPKGRRTRPTGDRVREAAFTLLGSVEGTAVLDLFAGSGAMGLEALSRGAASAVLVEQDRAALAAIDRNLEKLGLAGARVVRGDALRYLERTRERYDVIFVDPPYDVVESVRMRLATHLPRVLAAHGVVVLETAAADQPELPLGVRTSRRYGSARLTLLERSRVPRAQLTKEASPRSEDST